MVATRVMLGWAALALGLVPAPAAAAPRPNVIVILVDDLGYGDIGPFGSTLNRTPHLDRMAAEGMKLTSFYVAPVCTASRAQLLTGCYAKRVSLDGVLMPRDSKGLNPEERTVAEFLDEYGYATMCIGKWHLGAGPDFMPARHGFDRFLGLPYSNDMKGLQLFRDEQVVRAVGGAKDQTDLTEAYTAEAIRFIDEHQDRPFFLYLAHTAVHVPLAPGAAFAGRSGNGRFGDWVEEVDASTGRILEALRRQEVDTHTLVLFMSDNGPWLDRGAGNSGVAGPLRGGKFSTWEGGVRSPTLAWWPGRIPPGTVSDAVMGEIDVLPTLVGLAGAAVPDDRKIDGRDVWPVLSGATEKSPHEAYFLFSAATLHAVRSGPWKLAIAPQRDGRSKDAIDASLARPRLYDLSDDIGETTSVAADHPDVVERLLGHARAMDADLGIATSGPGVRPPGRSTGQSTPPAERKAGTAERPASGD